MFKNFFLIIFVFSFFSSLLYSEEYVSEKEVIHALKGGIESTKKFLNRVPEYQTYEMDKTILHYAVEMDNYDMVQFLISENVELSRRGGIYYQTALQDAIFYQYFRIARLLVNSGTDLNVQNIDGETALHIASRNAYVDMIQLLLSNGASKNIYNAVGNTAFELIPNFSMENTKELKKMLKPKKVIENSKYNIKNETFILEGMTTGGATFTLDEMNFDDQVGDQGRSSSSRAISINLQEETTTENSDIGVVIKSY